MHSVLLRLVIQSESLPGTAGDTCIVVTTEAPEVLKALAAGLDGQTIADRLGISIRTERNHVARILNKLGVHTQLQAVLFALRYGLIDEP